MDDIILGESAFARRPRIPCADLSCRNRRLRPVPRTSWHSRVCIAQDVAGPHGPPACVLWRAPAGLPNALGGDRHTSFRPTLSLRVNAAGRRGSPAAERERDENPDPAYAAGRRELAGPWFSACATGRSHAFRRDRRTGQSRPPERSLYLPNQTPVGTRLEVGDRVILHGGQDPGLVG